MSFPLPAFLPGLGLAGAIGLLIGFERGWQQRGEPDGRRVAGIRTFAMLGLFGGMLGIIVEGPLTSLAWIAAIGVVGALLIAHALDMRVSRVVSATAAVAAMMTLVLGALATGGYPVLASVTAALLVTLLAARSPLHVLVRASNRDEVQALVRLSLITLLVLPLLPDVALGPYASLNPRRLWYVVVVVGVLTFGGYVLQRWLGRRRGGLLTAALGAVVSSTAVTVACARQLRDTAGITSQAGISLGSTIMVTRTTILVAILAPTVFPHIVWLVGPALVLSFAATGILIAASRRDEGVPLEGSVKPPGFGAAFAFAALVALVTLGTAAVEHTFGSTAGTVVIVLGGMVDVDSAIAAIGALPAGTIPVRMAAVAVAAPVAFNSLLKLIVTISIAGLARSKWAAASLATTIALVLGAIVSVSA